MGTISLPYTFVAGQTPTATQWNSNPTTIATLVNGQIDKANVDSAGSDGIVTMDEAQTISGAKTFSGAVVSTGGITTGVDGTGVDIKMFGDTAGSFALWDQSADSLKFTDSTPITLGDDDDATIQFDATNTVVATAAQLVLTPTTDTIFSNGTGVVVGHTAQMR